VRSPVRKTLIYTLGGLFGGVLAAYAALLLVASAYERKVDRAWSDAGLPMRAFEEGLPRGIQNDSARKLEEIAARLGIAVAPLRGHDFPPATEWDILEADFRAYLESQLEEPTPEIGPPSEATAGYLLQKEPDLEDLRSLLLEEERPRWEMDPYRSWGVPFNRLGILYLQQCLAVDAMASFRGGDGGRCLRSLDASWALVESVSERPDLFSQDAALAMIRIQAGVLRKLEGVPPLWIDRMRVEVLRQALLRSFQYEAWGYWVQGRRLSRVPFYRRLNSRERILWRTFGRAWYRIVMADTSGTYLDEIRTLVALGGCGSDYRTAMGGILNRIPWWNTIGKGNVENLGIFWEREEYLKLDLELTRKILEVRRLRDENGGDWPKAVPGIEVSECPETSWTYAATPVGGMTLSFSREGTLPNAGRRILLPLRFEVPGTAGPAEFSSGRNPHSEGSFGEAPSDGRSWASMGGWPSGREPSER